MKRRITLSIALVLSVVLLALMKSDSTANAAPPQRYTYDTGYLTPGANQFIRITVALGDTATHEVGRLRFRRIQATQGSCSGGVCSHSVASQTTSDPLTIEQNGGFSTDIYSASPGQGVRGMVLSDNKNLRVIVMIIDAGTGAIVTSWMTEDLANQE